MSFFPLIMLITGIVFLSSCTDSGKDPTATAADSAHVTGPAPDNSSATNPSLADTNYEKDRTRPITDTMKRRDTIKKK
jgi:hypothetical protein